MTQLPDIILVLGNHHRWDALGLAGNKFAHTPNLDRLGQEGTWFSKAVTPFPSADQALSAVLTGAYPAQQPHLTADIQASELGALLAAAGYKVSQVSGRDSITDVTRQALSALESEISDPRAILVCLPSIWSFQDIEADCFLPYRGTGVPLATSFASVTAYDRAIGQMRDAIERCGRRNKTLFIYASTSGDQFKARDLVSQANTCHDEVIRVPLIISWPGHLPFGQTCDALVGLQDIAPTLCSLLARKLRAPHGQPLIPLIENPAESIPWRQRIYIQNKQRKHVRVVCDAQKNFHFDIFPDWDQRAIWDGRHKLILSADGGQSSLYDHAIDPEEEYDLFSIPGNDPMGAKDHFSSRAHVTRKMAEYLVEEACAIGDILGICLGQTARNLKEPEPIS